MYHYALGSVPTNAYSFRNGARIQIGRGVDHVPIIEIFMRRDYGSVPDDAVVLDLGANIGVFAVYAAVTARSTRVFAYEPMDSFYELLQENVRLNGCSDAVTCSRQAVAGTAAERALYFDGPDLLFPTLVPPDRTASGARVGCVSLDRILSDHGLARVDLLKMDIEGAEYEVLYGAESCLDRIREIRMEYHAIDETDRNVEGLQRFLTASGFRITRLKASSRTHGNLWAARS